MKDQRNLFSLRLTCIVIALFLSAATGVQAEPITLEPIRPLAQTSPDENPLLYLSREQSNGSSPYATFRQAPSLQTMRGGGRGQTSTLLFRGARSEHLQYRLDGILVNDPLSPSGGFDLSRWELLPWENIKLLAGPQPVIYGPGAMAGVILLETENSSALSAGAGSYGLWEIGGSWDGFSGSWAKAKGFSAADEALGNYEPDGFRIWNLGAKREVNWGEKTKISLVARATDSKTDTDSRGGAGGDKRGSFTRNYEWQGLFRAVHQPSEHQLLTGTLQTQYLDRFDNTVRDSRFESRQSEGEIKHVFSFRESKLTSILQARQEKGTSSDLDRRRSRGSGGLGLLLQSPLLKDYLFWEGGVRHDLFFPSGNAWSAQGSVWGLFSEQSGRWEIRWGRATKPPSLYQLYSIYGSESLNPEFTNSWQSQVSKEWQNWIFRGSAYLNRYGNMIDFDSSLSRFRSFAKAQTKGFEGEVRYQPGSLIFGLSAAYLRAVDLGNGEALLRRPRWTASGTVGFRKGAFAGAELTGRYTGTRPDLNPVSFQREKMPSYVGFDLHLFHRIRDSYQLDAYVENIGNRHFQTINGFGNGGRTWLVRLRREFL